MTCTANSRPARCAGPYRLQAPDHPDAPQGALLTSTRGTTRAILITSSFRGCPPSRERNLRKGSSSMFRIVVAPLLALSLAGVAVPVLAQSRGATPDGVERTDASDDFYCAERRLGQWFYCSKPMPAEPERQVSAGPQQSSVERMAAITRQLAALKAQEIHDPSAANVRTYLDRKRRRQGKRGR